jgi:hypothetical protein
MLGPEADFAFYFLKILFSPYQLDIIRFNPDKQYNWSTCVTSILWGLSTQFDTATQLSLLYPF